MTLGERIIDSDGVSDYVVCGSCQQDFPLANLVEFLQHKRFDCDDVAYLEGRKSLLCKSCPEKFFTPWKLLKHAQNDHLLGIFAQADNSSSENLQGHFNEVNIESGCASLEANCSTEPTAVDFLNLALDHNAENLLVGEQVAISVPVAEGEVVVGDVDEDSEKIAASCCCNDQSCGITVMPGTHAELEKCCSAVVPKKRKRHIVTKHLSNAFVPDPQRYFAKGNRMLPLARSRSCVTSSKYPADIYIDLASANDDIRYTMTRKVQSHGAGSIEDKVAKYGSSLNNIGKNVSPGNTQSVIIQPGSTFSIPILYRKTDRYAVQKLSLRSLQNSGVQLGKEKNKGKGGLSNRMQQPVLDAVTSEDSSHSMGNGDENQVDTDDTATSVAKGHKRRRYPTSRPFKCDKCEHSFNQRIHLRKHQSKHTGVKPFKCEQCDYSTVERSHLKVHIRVHTGEKPFKCTYCEYATAQNSTLKIHLKRHHAEVAPHGDGEENYVCEDCGSVFPTPNTLATHGSEHASTASEHRA